MTYVFLIGHEARLFMVSIKPMHFKMQVSWVMRTDSQYFHGIFMAISWSLVLGTFFTRMTGRGVGEETANFRLWTWKEYWSLENIVILPLQQKY